MTLQVLLVEDNPDDQLLAKRVIKQQQKCYQLHVAEDGYEALAWLFDTTNDLPDLIVLDINIPKINGLDVLKRIRREESTRCTPVVMLTTSDEESDINTSYARGANSYIKKPVNFNDFANTWKHIDEYWMQINTSPIK